MLIGVLLAFSVVLSGCGDTEQKKGRKSNI